MTSIVWYALDKAGNILEECEALDRASASLVFSVCCPNAVYVQSRPSYLASRGEVPTPKGEYE